MGEVIAIHTAVQAACGGGLNLLKQRGENDKHPSEGERAKEASAPRQRHTVPDTQAGITCRVSGSRCEQAGGARTRAEGGGVEHPCTSFHRWD